jgi:hypothetical protein
MPTLRITIKMDNAAFTFNDGYEAARILRVLAKSIDEDTSLDGFKMNLRDLNGNTVGEAKVTH